MRVCAAYVRACMRACFNDNCTFTRFKIFCSKHSQYRTHTPLTHKKRALARAPVNNKSMAVTHRTSTRSLADSHTRTHRQPASDASSVVLSRGLSGTVVVVVVVVVQRDDRESVWLHGLGAVLYYYYYYSWRFSLLLEPPRWPCG